MLKHRGGARAWTRHLADVGLNPTPTTPNSWDPGQIQEAPLSFRSAVCEMQLSPACLVEWSSEGRSSSWLKVGGHMAADLVKNLQNTLIMRLEMAFKR